MSTAEPDAPKVGESEEQITKSKRGVESPYDPSMCQVAADMCVNGATDFEVAEELGVCVRTLYRWKAKHPEFCQALKVGKEAADERVERSLYHRAVGYDHPAVKIMQNNGVPVYAKYIEHVPPDIGAVKMWLTNRKGGTWAEKSVQEQTITLVDPDPDV